MDEEFRRAEELLKGFKGGEYSFGRNALDMVGEYASKLGEITAIISGKTAKRTGLLDRVLASLGERKIDVSEIIDGARPNTPREDVYRIAYQLLKSRWDFVIVVGGGSCIDGAKAAVVLALHGGVIDDYLGVGMVSKRSPERIPLIAIQTASGSASHLTKYSNITDMVTHQKKLIVDEAIVPRAAVFQYDVTKTAPPDLTIDGAFDGISHCWEVWMGASGKPYYDEVSEVAYLGIKLIVENLPRALRDPGDLTARYGLGLGTDLGGYSIMIGGTNAAHLGSFSLVDVLTHGRACGILNPYYTVLFSNAIQDQLRRVAEIFKGVGLIRRDPESLRGRELAEEVAKAMIRFGEAVGFPTTLKAAGVTEEHLERMLRAARDPKLRMKLQGMPIPMDPDRGDIEKFMEPTIYAAYTGNMNFIPEMDRTRKI